MVILSLFVFVSDLQLDVDSAVLQVDLQASIDRV
jgi:hypothetical protein